MSMSVGGRSAVEFINVPIPSLTKTFVRGSGVGEAVGNMVGESAAAKAVQCGGGFKLPVGFQLHFASTPQFETCIKGEIVWPVCFGRGAVL